MKFSLLWKPDSANSAKFNLLRYFSITSFVAFVLVILVIGVVSRRIAVNTLIDVRQDNNAALAQVFSSTLWPSFKPFADSASERSVEELRADPQLERLHEAIRQQSQALSIIKIKIYNLDGLTVYSSEAAQIGEDKSDNLGFITARDGEIISEFTRRDSFSAFEGVIEDRNVVSSYVPIRSQDGSGRIEGVFEVYDDVTPFLNRIQRTQLRSSLMAFGLLSLLYLILFSIVWRGSRLINGQFLAIAEQQEQILINERRYRELVENTSDIVFSTDINGHFTYVSPSIVNLTGYAESELVGTHFSKLMNTEWHHKLLSLYQQQIRNSQAETIISFPIIRADGKTRWVEQKTSIILNENQRVVGFQSVVRDISERKEAEEKLNALYTVMAQPTLTLDEQLDEALKVGTQILGLELGIISRIKDENYTVLYGHSPDNSLRKGQVFDFRQTYCDLAYKVDDLVTIEHMSDSPYKNHPCYSAFGLEAYIGIPLQVNGSRFGTLSFYSPKPRQHSLTDSERDFFLLMGKWVITMLERKQAESALLASEANIRSILENSPLIITRIDPEYRINFMHTPGVELTLLEPLYGQSILSLVNEDYQTIMRAEFRRIFEDKQEVQYETASIDPRDGLERWYLTKAVPILEDDQVVSALLVSSDITERKASERILKQREAILEAVAFSSEQLLSNTDWEQAIQSVLAHLGQGAEASRAYVFQKRVVEGQILVDQRYEWAAEGVKAEIDNPDMQNFPMEKVFPYWVEAMNEWRMVYNVANDFPEDSMARQIIDSQGIRSVLIMPIWVDNTWWGLIGFDECTGQRTWTITEIEALQSAVNNLGLTIERQQVEYKVQSQNLSLVKANRELAVARKQAEAASKLKSQFLATMSHELRTPLNAVIGYAQIQLAGMVGPMSDEQLGLQARILTNAQHLLQLINEVLDLSKIEAGRMELAEKPFDLRECLQEIMLQSKVLADEKGLNFTLTIDERLPENIIGDRGRIKQIILNLVSNAIKFTDQGSVSIVTVLYNKESWRLTVTDTGDGISPHLQETIFDEFRQAENGLERGGTGLGLAIVRKLILMMGGNIRLNSELERGSSFTITLPIIIETQTSPQALET